MKRCEAHDVKLYAHILQKRDRIQVKYVRESAPTQHQPALATLHHMGNQSDWGQIAGNCGVEQNRPWMLLWPRDLLNYADGELSIPARTAWTWCQS